MAAMLVIKGATYTEKDVYPDGNQGQVFLLINEHLMQNHAISGSSSQAHEICVLQVSLKGASDSRSIFSQTIIILSFFGMLTILESSSLRMKNNESKNVST